MEAYALTEPCIVKEDTHDAKAHAVIEKWYRLGNMFYQGRRRSSHDFIEAKKWFQKAADCGHPEALIILNRMDESASQLQVGQAQTWFQMGLFYSEGQYGDEKAAEKWFLKAADQGHQQAQQFLRYYA